MNTYKLENVRLKTKIQQLEKEVDKKDKLLERIMEQMNADPSQSQAYSKRIDPETNLILDLKREVKDLRDQMQTKDDELQALERNLKGARIEEMELGLKLQSEECSKVRQSVEDAMQEAKDEEGAKRAAQAEEKLQQQSIMLTNMRKENEQLLVSVQRKDKEADELQETLGKAEERGKKYAKDHKDFIRNKRVLRETKKELESLRKQVAMLTVDKGEAKGADVYQARIEELIQQQRDLEARIADKDAKISALKPHGENAAVSHTDSEIQQLRIKAQDEEAELEELRRAQRPAERLSPVREDEVESDVKELKYVLMATGIAGSGLMKEVFSGYSETDDVSIYELARMISRIAGRQKTETERLARFLVETRDATAEYSELVEARVGAVCERLGRALGQYTVFSPESEAEIKRAICSV